MHTIEPPKEVMHIIGILEEYGYESYAVGGCVRDLVMGRMPKDWDITTSACPETVKGLFERTLDTGLKHGTVTVLIDKAGYEVTTFRIDGNYEDGRHPEYVEFTGSIEEDLRRRDFTINSMAWNPESGIIDLFGGMRDIAAGIVRAVGDPAERFREDALRMLRAVRFAARLGFDIESGTFDAIKDNSCLIQKVSAERIREELTGILMSEKPAKFSILMETGLLEHILSHFQYSYDLPAVGGLCEGSVESSLNAIAAVEADICLRWTMLLRYLGKYFAGEAFPKCCEAAGCVGDMPGKNVESIVLAEAILRKLKFSNKNADRILCLLRYSDMYIGTGPGDVARAVFEVGDDIFTDLLKVKRADAQINETSFISDAVSYIDGIEKIYCDLLASGCCMKLKDLAVNGEDLMRIGFSEGSDIGSTLSYLLDCVMQAPWLNVKDTLEKMALELLEARS